MDRIFLDCVSRYPTTFEYLLRPDCLRDYSRQSLYAMQKEIMKNFLLLILIITLFCCQKINVDPVWLYDDNYKMYGSYSATRERLFRTEFDLKFNDEIRFVIIEDSRGFQVIFYEDGTFGAFIKEEPAYYGGLLSNKKNNRLNKKILQYVKDFNKYLDISKKITKNNLPKIYNFPDIDARIIIITNTGYYLYKVDNKNLFLNQYYNKGLSLSLIRERILNNKEE